MEIDTVTANKKINYPKNRKPRPYKEYICKFCNITFKSRCNKVRYYCNNCEYIARQEWSKRWWKKNKVRYKSIRRESNLQRRYGISANHYDYLYKQQSGLCAICHKPYSSGSCDGLVVDHNHNTDEIRGLLCKSCNLTLGRLENNWNEFMEYLSVGFIGNRSL